MSSSLGCTGAAEPTTKEVVTDEDPKPEDSGEAETTPDYPGELDPLSEFGTAGNGHCIATSQGMVSWDGMGINKVEVVGFDDSVTPSPGALDFYRVGPCSQDEQDRSATSGAGTIDPRSGDDWHYSTTALNECYIGYCADTNAEACSGEWRVEITPVGGTLCSEFDKVRIDIDPKYFFAKRRANAQADCAAGSGRFRLAPMVRRDRDHDGSMTTTLIPIQTSGTGVMTNHAWITSATKVTVPTGKTLRMIKKDQEYTFSSADLLNNASTVSSSITGTHNFATGVMSGNAPFVLEEVSATDLFDAEVDLTWSCATVSPALSQPQGYSFSLADIGCGIPQRVTLRHPSSPKRIVVEPYGNPNVNYVSPTATVTDGEAFTVEIGRLAIEGVILSTSANNAQVRLDEITWDGASYCTPGTYTFGVE